VLTIDISIKQDGCEIHKQSIVVPSTVEECSLSANSGPDPRDRGLVPCAVCGIEQDDEQFRFASRSGKRSKSCLSCRTNQRTKALSIAASTGHVTRKFPKEEIAHREEWETVRDIAKGVLSDPSPGALAAPINPALAGMTVTKLPPSGSGGY
jgi:hypothetical protein